jgi:predicted transcriptional regulator
MHVIWEPGVTKAREVREELPDGRHYNSVLTIIRMLKRKGRLIHRVAGKADIYRAPAAREIAWSRASKDCGNSQEFLAIAGMAHHLKTVQSELPFQ